MDYSINVPIADYRYKDSNGEPISRVVEVVRLLIDWEMKEVVLNTRLRYININGDDISSDFKKTEVMLPANVMMSVPAQDENGNEILNENGNVVMTTFYDLLMTQLQGSIVVPDIITHYININTDLYE